MSPSWSLRIQKYIQLSSPTASSQIDRNLLLRTRYPLCQCTREAPTDSERERRSFHVIENGFCQLHTLISIFPLRSQSDTSRAWMRKLSHGAGCFTVYGAVKANGPQCVCICMRKCAPTDRPPVIAIYQQLISNKSTHASSTHTSCNPPDREWLLRPRNQPFESRWTDAHCGWGGRKHIVCTRLLNFSQHTTEIMLKILRNARKLQVGSIKSVVVKL